MESTSNMSFNALTMATISAIGLSSLPVEVRTLAINLLQDPDTPCTSQQLQHLALQACCDFKFLSVECRRCLLQRTLEVACGLHSSEALASAASEGIYDIIQS